VLPGSPAEQVGIEA